MKSGLQARKAKGVKLGRQNGQQVKSKYDADKEKIEELHNLGLPISKIIDYIGVGIRQSLTTYIKTRNLGLENVAQKRELSITDVCKMSNN